MNFGVNDDKYNLFTRWALIARLLVRIMSNVAISSLFTCDKAGKSVAHILTIDCRDGLLKRGCHARLHLPFSETEHDHIAVSPIVLTQVNRAIALFCREVRRMLLARDSSFVAGAICPNWIRSEVRRLPLFYGRKRCVYNSNVHHDTCGGDDQLRDVSWHSDKQRFCSVAGVVAHISSVVQTACEEGRFTHARGKREAVHRDFILPSTSNSLGPKIDLRCHLKRIRLQTGLDLLLNGHGHPVPCCTTLI